MKIIKSVSTLLFAIALVGVAGCASTATHEGTGQYVDDSVITTKVKAGILHEPGLKSAEINVETFKGVVQLSGFVANPSSISKAGEVASNVNGVKSVQNDLHVK
jgi:osmotically-inducible protein OsmY